jgi:integrase
MARNLIPGDRTLRAIKPGDPRKRISDGDGLYLRLFVNGGSHGWRFDYTFEARRLTLSLGTYPDTGLALAREKATKARELIAAGGNPSAERKVARASVLQARQASKLEALGLPAMGTFEQVAREWLELVHSAKVSTGHTERTRLRLEQNIFPWIGRRPIGEIEPPEVLACLRRVEGRGAIETAHRVKDACGQVFRYGIAAGVCRRNPAADLRDALRPVPTRHHAAIVDPDGTAKLLKDVMGYQGQPVTRLALVLSALLLLRPGELRHMEWAWVDFESATLTLPPSLMKRQKAAKTDGPPHVVPLAVQSVTALRELEGLTGAGRYVFPSLLSAERCMSENTVRGALRRLGYGNDDMTAHGFRAMARTLIAERLSFPPEVIEAQLAHAVPDALGRAYNRAQFLDQRRVMMQSWADYLDQLRTSGSSTQTHNAPVP